MTAAAKRKRQLDAYERMITVYEAEKARVDKRFRMRIAAARIKLAENCDHPAKFVTEYNWEHDNGYGRQKWIKGKACGICGARQSWADFSGWLLSKPSEG